jgi:fluoride ion exporter CrcB/FEX
VPEEVTLKVNETPTIFNKEMAIGFLLFNVVGALVGGFIGKERMAREAQEGRRLDAPSFWNKEAALGGLLGAHLGVAAAFIAASLATPIFATAIAAAAVAGAGLIGLAIGGSWGKRQQERECALAVQQHGEGQNDPMQSVVRDILREVQSEHVPSHRFAARVEAERLKSASRENQIT